ncbi:hypothetical protein [Streptomyces sp. CA-111067]|uniref:hypothetical protein n=1 Tax=Streptomyces sp. CA-111067 TaxID=3240046 RepID=UPI003D969519
MVIETLLLRHDQTGGFAYRRLHTGLSQGNDPDRTARRLAGLDGHQDEDGDGDGHLVHSTSWRAGHEGEIILTYLVHPDPDPARPAVALADPHDVARGDRPGRPAPLDLTLDHVAAHAVRHLAFLARTDPTVTAFAAARPAMRRALDIIPGVPAGQFRTAAGEPLAVGVGPPAPPSLA